MTSPDPFELRIGDAERDEAIEALREHHSLGRLDAVEFEERMEKALKARLQRELLELFTDLPDPKPQLSATQLPPPSGQELSYTGQDAQQFDPADDRRTSWYGHWWWILVAVGITMASNGAFGFVIPMAAIWLWVVFPMIRSSRRRSSLPPPYSGHPQQLSSAGHGRGSSPLADWQRNRIDELIKAGDKITAIRTYRDYTGASLLEAKNQVEQMSRRWER